MKKGELMKRKNLVVSRKFILMDIGEWAISRGKFIDTVVENHLYSVMSFYGISRVKRDSYLVGLMDYVMGEAEHYEN